MGLLNEVTRKELGKALTLIDKIWKRRLTVRARNKDGGKETTGSSAIRTSGGNKKLWKTTKEVDR